jgi:hypothetical protein
MRAAFILLAVLLALRPGAGVAQDAPVVAAQPPQTEDARARSRAADIVAIRRFTLQNHGSVAMTEVRILASGVAGDGANRLRAPLAAGESRELTAPACNIDLHVRYANDRVLIRRVDICADPLVRMGWRTVGTINRPAIAPSKMARPPVTSPPSPMPAPPPQVQPPVPSPITLPATLPATLPTATPRNGQQQDPTPAAPSAPGPVQPAAAQPGPGSRVWCPALEERMSAEDCATLSAVARGTGAFKTPERIERGKHETVILAVSRVAGSTDPSAAIAGAEGVERRFAPAVGRYMEASLLSGPGLEIVIDPRTAELQDLGAGDGALWRWTITAVDPGTHELTIRTRVMTRLPDGSFTPRGSPYIDTRKVTVFVSTIDVIADNAENAGTVLTALSKPTENLSTLVGAIAALLAAIGGLWFAVRNFGKKAD